MSVQHRQRVQPIIMLASEWSYSKLGSQDTRLADSDGQQKFKFSHEEQLPTPYLGDECPHPKFESADKSDASLPNPNVASNTTILSFLSSSYCALKCSFMDFPTVELFQIGI